MRRSHLFGLLALTLVTGDCVDPLRDDFGKDWEQKISSVAGPWTGISEMLTLDFELKEGAGGAVSGTGTMKEGASGTVAITMTGTFQRPQLSLTFHGMRFEGHAVEGTFQGSYTTIGGISAPLHLTAEGYSRDVQMLMQEP